MIVSIESPESLIGGLMDKYIIEKLLEGNTWLFVGSGVSNEMGYPSHSELVQKARDHFQSNLDVQVIDKHISRKDYPSALQTIQDSVSRDALRLFLKSIFSPKKESRLYPIIARWPIPVYLTTNYDDEISKHLSSINTFYKEYSNSVDHIKSLNPGSSKVIYKLHGSLEANQGLILSLEDYQNVLTGPEWTSWRNKLEAIFTAQNILVIGHSLSDPNVKMLLDFSKSANSIDRPLYWIAPESNSIDSKKMLFDYNVQLISYPNADGRHRNLINKLETIDRFLYSRASVGTSVDAKRILKTGVDDKSRQGFFIFNALYEDVSIEKNGPEALYTALKASLDKFAHGKKYSFSQVWEISNVSSDLGIEEHILQTAQSMAIEEKILVENADGTFSLGDNANQIIHAFEVQYNSQKQAFYDSLRNRLEKASPDFPFDKITKIIEHIDHSLASFFREEGLYLAKTIYLPQNNQPPLPFGLIDFLSEAANQCSSQLERHLFLSTTTEMFTNANPAEKSFLGRVAQGYFSLHALGLSGEVISSRLRHVRNTVWLIDSNFQIPLLAQYAEAHDIYEATFIRCKKNNIHLFTTRNLFAETYNHFKFAQETALRYRADITMIGLGAIGKPPFFTKPNQFLEGFIRWIEKSGSDDWETYCNVIFGEKNPDENDLIRKLADYGIRVLDFSAWPGFAIQDRSAAEEIKQKIIDEGCKYLESTEYAERYSEIEKKARPESEAVLIVNNERKEKYNILDIKTKHEAWFISQTKVLNKLNLRIGFEAITWPPEAFLRLISTLLIEQDPITSQASFDMLLLAYVNVGYSLITEDTLKNVLQISLSDRMLDSENLDQRYISSLKKDFVESIEHDNGRSVESKMLAYTVNQEKTIEDLTEKVESLNSKVSQQYSTIKEQQKVIDQYQHIQIEIDRRRTEAARKKRKRKSKRK